MFIIIIQIRVHKKTYFEECFKNEENHNRKIKPNDIVEEGADNIISTAIRKLQSKQKAAEEDGCICDSKKGLGCH